MVMMADSLNNDNSPRSPVTDAAIAAASAAGGGVNSPQSRRRGLVSPWASVVRGDSDSISSPTAAASRSSTSPPSIAVAAPEQLSASEKSPIESSGLNAQPESSDVNSDGNAGRPRRHAWNTPVNGVVEPVSVMGDAVSWPALSESTRAVPRSSSEPSRPVPDGSSSSSQGPIISQPPQRQANTNAHVNSTANNIPTRQRSRHRGGGVGGGGSSGSGPSSSAFSRQPPPPPPPFPVFDMHSYANMVPPMLDTPVRGTRPGGGVGGSQPHTGNDHSSPRNSSRRGNYGPRPRGDGSYHNNHGGRRDQDRRDVHLSHQYVPPVGYMPSPLAPGPTPFMAPPVRVFPGQMGFDMSPPFIYVPTLPPESFRPMPMVPPPPPMLFATNDHLPSLIVKQIDYYFSDENLVKDNFLRSNMDDQGWVPITLIASFPRVLQLTYDVPLILDSLRNSTIVEVQGDKLRKRNEWKKWLHNTGWSNTDSGPLTPGSSSENVLATSFQKVSLDDATIDANGAMGGQTEMSPGKYTSDETTASSMLGNGEDTAEDARSMNM